MYPMIKYHILALLCLVAAGISLIELLAVYYTTKGDFTSVEFWLMVFVFAFSIMMYFRIKRLRKEALLNQKK
jgi:Kef-type K+ transport system membrane component KefB